MNVTGAGDGTLFSVLLIFYLVFSTSFLQNQYVLNMFCCLILLWRSTGRLWADILNVRMSVILMWFSQIIGGAYCRCDTKTNSYNSFLVKSIWGNICLVSSTISVYVVFHGKDFTVLTIYRAEMGVSEWVTEERMVRQNDGITAGMMSAVALLSAIWSVYSLYSFVHWQNWPNAKATIYFKCTLVYNIYIFCFNGVDR